MVNSALQKDLAVTSDKNTFHSITARTFELAKIAPKLYEGRAVWEAREKEWVTWNAGLTDRALVRSARAPSKM